MRGFLMFVGAIAFTGILGVGFYWFVMNTKFGKIKSNYVDQSGVVADGDIVGGDKFTADKEPETFSDLAVKTINEKE